MGKIDYRPRCRQLEEEMMASSDPYEWWRQITGGLTQKLALENERLHRINPQNFSMVGEDAGDFLDAASTILSFAPQPYRGGN